MPAAKGESLFENIEEWNATDDEAAILQSRITRLTLYTYSYAVMSSKIHLRVARDAID